MSILFHIYEIKKTYIFVSHLFFDDKVEETKLVLDRQTWSTTFFYLVTLFIVFILGCVIRFIFTNKNDPLCIVWEIK